jgi:DNA-directed RNA polymerase subunit RPC12/RpoP
MHRILNMSAPKMLAAAVFLLQGLFLLNLTACRFQPGWGYNQGYAPEQPLPFDHSVHVTKNGIQCQYCHNQVERSKHSNIPALSTCMNCHIQVKTDSPHIQKLREAYDKGDSIKWVRVHLLPDFVHFNHSAHIAKGVNCQTCHGPIETMSRVSQVADLSMGWCINCHRQPENKAPLNCTTCHH